MKLPNVFRRVRVVEEPKPKQPMALDLNSKFVYKAGADVMATWRKHGFVPPTEYRNDYLFKKNREHHE